MCINIYIYRDFDIILYITVYLQKHRRGLELQTRWTLGKHSPVEIVEKNRFDSWVLGKYPCRYPQCHNALQIKPICSE